MRSIFTLMMLPIALSGAAQAQQDCSLQMWAKLDLAMTEEGRVTVPIGLNGKSVRPMVDTGAYWTVISGGAAKKAGLTPKLSIQDQLIGFSGNRINHYVEVDETTIGPLNLKDLTYMVDLNMPSTYDGLLGPDYFKNFDVDLDFAKARMNLFNPRHCEGKVVYWTGQPYAIVPFEYKQHHITLTVNLDGKDVDAMLDTGAAMTVMSLETAQELYKVDPASLAKTHNRYPFKAMSLGGLTVKNPAIVLVGEQEGALLRGAGPKMILGMTALRQLHLFISYGEKKIYATGATTY